MTYETSAAARKAAKLARIAQEASTAGGSLSPEAWLNVVNHFASIRPPEVSSSIGLVIMQAGGSHGGHSVKPGNITFNMRKLTTAISSGILTAVAGFHTPWTAVFGAILLWDRVYAGATVELSEREAAVLWTMWQLSDHEGTVAHDGLFAAVNSERAKYGGEPLSNGEFDSALTRLENIRTIERFSRFRSRWWLREWVRVEYQQEDTTN